MVRGWTLIEGGDMGEQHNSWRESDTGYYGAASPAYEDNIHEYSENHELNEMRPHRPQSSPLLNPKLPSKKSSRLASKDSLIRPRISGWKAGVLSCAMTAGTVCLLNISLTGWAVTNHKVVGGLSYLYTGSCKEVANMSLWIHLAINAMSTLLLSASNYTMQIISSPTRKEVDKAHEKGRWLDIGIPSTRNLWGISRLRIIMWCVLGLSSVPLHLLYNTAVFSSLSANEYNYVVVSEQFVTASAVFDQIDTYTDDLYSNVMNGTFKNYTAEACVQQYASSFVSTARNALLITSDVNNTNNVFFSEGWNSDQQIPYAWICGDGFSFNPYDDSPPLTVCTSALALKGINNWVLDQHPIRYCMIEEVPELCKLSFSLPIMLVVILANAVKCSVMLLTFFKLKEPTLVTIGDGIASFLDRTDQTTKGICLSTRQDIRNGRWKSQSAKKWVPKKRFWFRSASVKRWLTCNILCIAAIITGVVLFNDGTGQINIYDISELWQLGFGTVTANSIVQIGTSGLMTNVLLANLPQFILSFLYLTYNGLFTCCLSGYEWSLFGTKKKGLRVTAPVGRQRSTYYLQLPYWYAIPLLIMSGTLHWLMSQSLFLALVTVYDSSNNPTDDSISSVGFSCIAIFFSIIAGTIAVLAGILNGFRTYDDTIPVVGSCSAAISAACHRPEDDTSASLLEVSWGVVEGAGQGDVGHCCFSSFETVGPKVGNLYAGKGKVD